MSWVCALKGQSIIPQGIALGNDALYKCAALKGRSKSSASWIGSAIG